MVEEKLDEQVEHMKRAFEETAAEMGARVAVDIDVMYPAFKYGPDEQVVKVAVKAAEKIGRKGRLIKSGGGSDANIFNGFGIPTLVLGVGYEEIHTTKEKMPIAELNKLTEMVLAIIEIVNEMQ